MRAANALGSYSGTSNMLLADICGASAWRLCARGGAAHCVWVVPVPRVSGAVAQACQMAHPGASAIANISASHPGTVITPTLPRAAAVGTYTGARPRTWRA
jgi:hypothetical protein